VLIALPLAAFVAGLAGTWSPCGLSAIDTLRPRGHGPARAAAALGAFAAGALLGGAATFTALAALGGLAGAHVRGARVVFAVVLAGAGALADLGGAPVRPQIRRQVPEPWRRRWPLPAAAGAYGVLLGLGFTTYVLAFAVWIAAALTVALGSPALGLAAGIAFGAGRALPVVALAPIADRLAAARFLAAMAERRGPLRAVRMTSGAALLACAATVALAPGAAAKPRSAAPAATARSGTVVAAPATDPSAEGGTLAWQVPGGVGMLHLADGRTVQAPGSAPAVGGGLLAYLDGGAAQVVQLATGQPIATVPTPDADALAVSARWLALRHTGASGNTTIAVVGLAPVTAPRTIASARAPAALGRPALDGDRLVWARSSGSATTIRELDLAHHVLRTPVHARLGMELAAPSIRAGSLLYVRATRCGQALHLRSLSYPSRDRILLRRGPLGRRDRGFEPGHTSQGSGPSRCAHRHRARTMLWSTALTLTNAYVTLVDMTADGSLGAARVVRLRR
jgi:hypothetical protein